jgi:hypothetical protein
LGGAAGGGEVAEVVLLLGSGGAQRNAGVEVASGFEGGVGLGLDLGIRVVLLLADWIVGLLLVSRLRGELLLLGELPVLVELLLLGSELVGLSELIVACELVGELLLLRVLLGVGLLGELLELRLLLRISLLWIDALLGVALLLGLDGIGLLGLNLLRDLLRNLLLHLRLELLRRLLGLLRLLDWFGLLSESEGLCGGLHGWSGSAEFEDIDDAAAGLAHGRSRGAHWLDCRRLLHRLHLLPLSGLGELACYFFKWFFCLRFDLGLSLLPSIIVCGWLIILGVFVLIQGRFIVGIIPVGAETVAVIVGLILRLLLLVVELRVAVTAAPIATASVSASPVAVVATVSTCTVAAVSSTVG